MYILVQAGTQKGAKIVAIAASESIDALKAFAQKDAFREFGVRINESWRTDQIFPYVLIPEHYSQYYIREIEYVR